MSAEGWTTKLCMWRESNPARKWRPPGVASVNLKPSTLTAWHRRDAFGHITDSQSIQQAWTMTFQRQVAADFLAAEWLLAVAGSPTASRGTAAGAIDRDEAPAQITWAMQIVFPDGSARQVNGLALRKWEMVMQSGRAGLEEIELVALTSDEIDAADFLEPLPFNYRFSAGPYISHAFTAGVYTGDSMTSGDKIRTFSTQIIFDRSIEAAQFNAEGRAQRHSATPWAVSGRSVLRMAPEHFQAAQDAAIQAAMWWEIKMPTGNDVLRISLPATRAKISAQELIAGQIDHSLDYVATAIRRGMLARFTADFSPLEPPPPVFYYLRPDGISRYVRPDGSFYTHPMADVTLTPEMDALLTAPDQAAFVAALVALGLPGNTGTAEVSTDGVFLEFKGIEDGELIGKTILEA